MEQHAGLLRFFRKLVEFRKSHPALRREHFFDGEKSPHNQFPDIRWYANHGNEPQWNGPRSTLGCFINGNRMEIAADKDDNDFFMMFNSSPHDRMFVVPVPPSLKIWRVAIDTGRESPDDIMPAGRELEMESQTLYRIKSRSVVVLLSF